MPFKELVNYFAKVIWKHCIFCSWFDSRWINFETNQNHHCPQCTPQKMTLHLYECGFNWLVVNHNIYVPPYKSTTAYWQSFQTNCTYQNRNKNITESWFCTLFQQFPFFKWITKQHKDLKVLCSLMNTWGDYLTFENQNKEWSFTLRKIKLKAEYIFSPSCYKYSTVNLNLFKNLQLY